MRLTPTYVSLEVKDKEAGIRGVVYAARAQLTLWQPMMSRSIPPITRQKRRPLELQCKQSFRLDHVRDADA